MCVPLSRLKEVRRRRLLVSGDASTFRRLLAHTDQHQPHKASKLSPRHHKYSPGYSCTCWWRLRAPCHRCPSLTRCPPRLPLPLPALAPWPPTRHTTQVSTALLTLTCDPPCTHVSMSSHRESVCTCVPCRVRLSRDRRSIPCSLHTKHHTHRPSQPYVPWPPLLPAAHAPSLPLFNPLLIYQHTFISCAMRIIYVPSLSL